MILPYGLTRRLRDNAVPSLNLVSFNIPQHANVDTFSDNVQLVENVPNKSDFVLSVVDMNEENVHESTRSMINKFKRKLRTQRKMLHKKKQIIYNQRQHINRLRRGNKWEEIIKNASNTQKLFFEILTTNLKCAPQVCFINFYICILCL